jgi:hypothetical protein
MSEWIGLDVAGADVLIKPTVKCDGVQLVL